MSEFTSDAPSRGRSSSLGSGTGGREDRRLAPTLMELFPDRVMLSSRELAEIVKLEESGVPAKQLLTWAQELRNGRRGLRLSQVLPQLHQRAKRWQNAHIGGKYREGVTVSQGEIERAFEELISEVRRAEASSHEPQLHAVFSWLTRQLSTLQQRATYPATHPEYQSLSSVLEGLRKLEEELQARVLTAIPDSLRDQVSKQVRASLKREALRARPQDFLIAQRAVYWAALLKELSLPPMRLSLFNQW